jgi:hypothetical protein
MEDLPLEINTEIINKITNSLYKFYNSDAYESNEVFVVEYYKSETRMEMKLNLKKNENGIITDGSIHTIISNGVKNKKKKKNH